MCASNNNNEKSVLTFSALAASFFAVGGIILGYLVSSMVIIFDGVYSSVSLVLTLLSLAVSYYIQRPQKQQFPFGKALLEPAVIAIKGLVILSIVFYSLFEASQAMLSGGRDIDTSIATLFGVVNVLGCGLAWGFIAHKNKTVSSNLVKAEMEQWKMDTWLSVAVTLGFCLSMVLTWTPWANLAVYADPMMMILISFYFIKVPMCMLKNALKELFMMSPNPSLCQQVDRDIHAVGQLSQQRLKLAALTKVGQELRVHVDLHLPKQVLNVQEFEQTRTQLTKQLAKHDYDVQLQLNIAY